MAIGPRSSLIVLVACALEPTAIAELALKQPLESLKDVIKQNMTFDQVPELFCFGLLERFDMPQLYSLVGWGRFAETGSLDDFVPEGKSEVKSPKSKVKGGSQN